MTIQEIVEQQYEFTELRRRAYEDVRAELGVSTVQFWRKKTGKSRLTLDEARKVANKLNVPIEQLS